MVGKEKNLEHKSFIALLIPNQMRIQAFIITLVPNVSDAEDIYQETVSTMWDKISTFEKGTDFVAWAVTIAKYKVLEFRNKQKKSKIQFVDNIYGILESAATSKMSIAQDRLDSLKKCIQKLTKNEIDLLKMRYAEDLSFQKMSLRIGKTSPALYRVMAIIHSKLALCIRRFLYQEGII
jgi:RNA polymerase sigma-70 factor (ECF subfamily)